MRLFSPSVKQNPNEKEKRLGPLTAVDTILGWERTLKKANLNLETLDRSQL